MYGCSCSSGVLSLVVLGAAVTEPPTAAGAADSTFLVVDEPRLDSSPLSIRLLSGVTPLRTGAERLDLLYSGVGVAAAMTQ